MTTGIILAKDTFQNNQSATMIFNNAWKCVLKRNVNAAFSSLGRRGKSTTADGGEVVSAASTGALLAAVGTTFVTYMTADFLSNFLQHPTQKVRDCSRDVYVQ